MLQTMFVSIVISVIMIVTIIIIIEKIEGPQPG